jgi:hypothetical protein
MGGRVEGAVLITWEEEEVGVVGGGAGTGGGGVRGCLRRRRVMVGDLRWWMGTGRGKGRGRFYAVSVKGTGRFVDGCLGSEMGGGGC